MPVPGSSNLFFTTCEYSESCSFALCSLPLWPMLGRHTAWHSLDHNDINADSNPQNYEQISRLCPPGCQLILIRFTSLSNCQIKTFPHLHWYCLHLFVNSEWSWFCAKLLGTMQTLATAAIPDASHSKVHVWGHDRYGHPQKLGWKWLATAFNSKSLWLFKCLSFNFFNSYSRYSQPQDC